MEWMEISDFRAGDPEQKVNLCQKVGSKIVD
jgi:hypothetical protein